ncbi:MAG: hypothetical protein V4772_08800 [Pseudomonadota bacterium]
MKPKRPKTHYTHWDVMLADPINPMPETKWRNQLTKMWQGLADIESAESPSTEDWKICSDAVNLMETLQTKGHIVDESGLLMDGITALALAGKRHLAGKQIRLDGPGIAAIRAVLHDYEQVLRQLPERLIISCHMATEQRIQAILAGRKLPHDVEVVSL